MATLIYYDQSAHQAAQREAADVAARFTELLTLYQVLNLPSVETADLGPLLADPTTWLLGKYSQGQQFKLFGLTFQPAKVLELIERPAGFTAFVEAATILSQDLGIQARPAEPDRFWHPDQDREPRRHFPQWQNHFVKQVGQYAVVGGVEVRLSKEGGRALESRFKSYATTPRQEKLLAALKTICAGISQLPEGTLSPNNLLGQGGGGLSEALIVSQYEAAPVRPNPAFVLRHN